jgi:hypothetical protein
VIYGDAHGRVFQVLRRGTSRRVITWLAMLAMLLIVVMPAISRVMPMPHAMAGMAEPCPLHMAAMAHPAAPDKPADSTDRCAYCVLLDHQSMLASGKLVHVLAAPPAVMVATPPIARGATTVPLLSADPRGPPTAA